MTPLPAVLALLGAALLGEGGQETPAGAAGELGLPDSELWDRVWTRSDVLGDLDFRQALVQDPRRIDALIQQHLLDPILRPLMALQAGTGGVSADLARQLYVLRNAALREAQGRITAPGLAALMQDEWGEYGPVLDKTLVAMARAGDRRAQAMVQGLRGGWTTIEVAFQSAATVARRAAADSVDAADARAWTTMAELLEASKEALDRSLRSLPEQFGLSVIDTSELLDWTQPMDFEAFDAWMEA